MNQNIKKALMSVVVSASAFLSAYAVPAYPGKIKAVQPDGTVITIRQHGDEHFSWAETPDGYTLLRDSEGYWAFAREARMGMLEASDQRYFNSRPTVDSGIRPGLRITAQQISTARRAQSSDLQIDESFPANGRHRLLMLLVNFSDTNPIYDQSQFDAMMNQEGYNGIGSFRDFYNEASYGNLDIETTVTRWITLPHAKSFYGSDGAIAIIRDALTILDDEINLADFDNDGDGVLDGLAVIHQGPGQEYTASSIDIWSHSSVIYGMEFDGIQVRRYTIEPELLGKTGRMSTMGVVCHEFGHNLGAPDFYDTDYSSSGGDYCGTGVWDLLGSGAWNGDSGDRPAGINMWQKIQFGWCTPVTLSETTTVSGMLSADKAPTAYKMETTVPGEYYILENRQQSGNFDKALPGHGLIIYHVNEALIRQTVLDNLLNVTYPQAIYTVCSSAGQEPSESPSSFGDINSDGAPFPGAKNITEFSDRTLPSAKSLTGRYTYKSLANIAENNGEMSFTFTREMTPEAPVNLTATAERGIVRLVWQLPDGVDRTDIEHFTVYRDGSLIGTTDELEYTDNSITSQTSMTYYVDAVYTSGLVSPYVQTSVRIPTNYITAVTGNVSDAEPAEVRLTWDINTMLSRMVSQTDYEKGEYNVPSLDYVHRFLPDDLRIYAGYKIRRIGFLPVQGPKDLTFTLRVWEADADGANPRIVSERAIKEYGNSVWNDLLLTSSVEINSDRQMWIGLHCETNTGCIQILNDRSSLGHGLGNWIKTADGEWTEDASTAGNYYLRFTLLAPSGELVPVELGDVGSVTNPNIELAYPLGFSVYRDGEFIGSTASRCFIDASPLTGTHIYSISNLYKGGNESVTTDVEVVVPSYGSGISDVLSLRTPLTVNGRIVYVPACSDMLVVYDMLGRKVYSASDRHVCEPVYLSSGVYMIKTEGGMMKIAVK